MSRRTFAFFFQRVKLFSLLHGTSALCMSQYRLAIGAVLIGLLYVLKWAILSIVRLRIKLFDSIELIVLTSSCGIVKKCNQFKKKLHIDI